MAGDGANMVLNEKTDQKLKITRVKIVCLTLTQFGWFWEWTLHAYQRQPRIFKNSWKFWKSNSQEIEPKLWYPHDQDDSLNHFYFLKQKTPIQKIADF